MKKLKKVQLRWKSRVAFLWLFRTSNLQKSMSNNTLISRTILLHFYCCLDRFLEPQIDLIVTTFWLRCENADFVKIRVSPRREHENQGFEGLEINQKSTDNRYNIEM